MAIITRKNSNSTVSYQVKIRGIDGRFITKTFARQGEARKYEAELNLNKAKGGSVVALANNLTVSEFWNRWSIESRQNVSDGWKKSQNQMFFDYVEPVIGRIRLNTVRPESVRRVLVEASKLHRSPQTLRHIFNLMHRIFRDAVEDYELLFRNPVTRKLKPSLPEKERRHLTEEQSLQLLGHIEGEDYELLVWLGLVAGLRVGEIQALRWENVDLVQGILHVRTTYVRREGKFRDYPKGKRWHSIPMPPDLIKKLEASKPKAIGEYVVVTPGSRNKFACYNAINRALKRYCVKAEVPVITPHELRHSTASIYLANGATRDDMRALFAHSDSKVTDRYLHTKNERLEKVAMIIRLFPDKALDNTKPLNDLGCSQAVPIKGI